MVDEVLTIDFSSTEPPTAEEVDGVATASIDDRDWFAAHPGRKYRFRLMSTAEYARCQIPLRSTDTPAILVHQMAPGVRRRFYIVITFSALDARWARYFNGDDAVLEPVYQQALHETLPEIRKVCEQLREGYQKNRGT